MVPMQGGNEPESLLCDKSIIFHGGSAPQTYSCLIEAFLFEKDVYPIKIATELVIS